MSKRHTTEQLQSMLSEATLKYGSSLYLHKETGAEYFCIGAMWCTDQQIIKLAYTPRGVPGVIFARDMRVFDGEKFERIEATK